MYVALDKDGIVVAMQNGGGNRNPFECPEGGSLDSLSDEVFLELASAFREGKRVKLQDGNVLVSSPPTAPRTEDTLKKARRDKLIEASTITHVRDKDDKDTGIYTPVGLRHLDIAVLYLDGDLKPTDTIWVRNNQTHHEDRITLAQWKASLLETFTLRQSLREREQALRDQVEAIANDAGKTDEQKVAEIQSIEIPKEVKDGK